MAGLFSRGRHPAATVGLDFSFGLWFYKDAAPTALK
jgi:hypothetical protein